MSDTANHVNSDERIGKYRGQAVYLRHGGTMTEDDVTKSTPKYFSVGKHNIAAMPLYKRCRHAVTQCMLEAGHTRPDWQYEDGVLLAFIPDRVPPEQMDDYGDCLTRALNMVEAEMGWPETDA